MQRKGNGKMARDGEEDCLKALLGKQSADWKDTKTRQDVVLTTFAQRTDMQNTSAVGGLSNRQIHRGTFT